MVPSDQHRPNSILADGFAFSAEKRAQQRSCGKLWHLRAGREVGPDEQDIQSMTDDDFFEKHQRDGAVTDLLFFQKEERMDAPHSHGRTDGRGTDR